MSNRPGVYPITLKQRERLITATRPDFTPLRGKHWTMSDALLVRTGIDMRRLTRAAQKVWARHDSLRIRQRMIRGDWRAVIEPNAQPVIREIDLGDQDDATFEASIREIAQDPIPMIDAPLAEIVVVHCGARGDVAVTRAHNTIVDGYGFIVLLEDMLKALVGLPFTGTPVSHAEFIARYERPSPDREAEVEAYWEKMLRDFPPIPNIGRKAKGLSDVVNAIPQQDRTGVLRFHIPPATMARFEGRTKALNVAPSTGLFTGFLEAISRKWGLDPVMFCAPVARTDPALAHAVCDQTFSPIYRYTSGPPGLIDDKIKRLAEMMLEALHYMPADAVRRKGRISQRILEAGGHPRQFVVFQPLAQTRVDQSFFAPRGKRWYGQDQNLGGHVFCPIDVRRTSRVDGDLDIALPASFDPPGFFLKYDAVGFEREEIIDISERICDLLELKDVEMEDQGTF